MSRDAALIEKMRDLRDYDERDNYIPRFNYRMSDLAAGTGRRQLRRLPEFIRRRRMLAAFYSEQLSVQTLRLPAPGEGSIHYRYVVRSHNVEQHIESLRSLGIQAKRPVYTPLHRYTGRVMPRTDRAYRTALSLPLYPALTDLEAEFVVSSINSLETRPTQTTAASRPYPAPVLAPIGAD